METLLSNLNVILVADTRIRKEVSSLRAEVYHEAVRNIIFNPTCITLDAVKINMTTDVHSAMRHPYWLRGIHASDLFMELGDLFTFQKAPLISAAWLLFNFLHFRVT